MSNINWKVESCKVHTTSRYTPPAIEVSLSGTDYSYFPYNSATIDDLVRDIETKLNPQVGPGCISLSDTLKIYVQNDIETTAEITHTLSHSIKNVIFNDPATIVFWHDGTKTVVKCGEDDIFDPEKGLAMAISKKFLGNQGNYYNEIKKWVGADLYMNEKTHNDLENLFDNITVDALAENMRNLLNRLEGRK